MAALAFLVLILAMAGHASANWCVCKSGISEKELQKTLDYACGAGADCNPTHSGGPCFNPNSVQAHCSYAVNSYFQKKGQAQGTCDFSGTATVVTSDPSTSSTCAYPATASVGTDTVSGFELVRVTLYKGQNGDFAYISMPPFRHFATSTGTTPITTTPSSTTTTTTGTPSSTATPYSTTTPSNGVLGGIGNGMGPSGMNDESDGTRLRSHSLLFSSSMATLFLSGLMLWWA